MPGKIAQTLSRLRHKTIGIPIHHLHHSLRAGAGDLRELAPDCRGSLLLETVIAVMVFSMVGTAALTGINTSYNTGAMVEMHSSAENIARNQMEYIFSQSYRSVGQTPYSTVSPPTGYGVSAATEEANPSAPDPDIERLVVTVSRDGQDVLVLTALRFNK